MVVAKYLDERQRAGGRDDTAHRTHGHAEDGEHFALVPVARHRGRQRAVGQVDGGVADGGTKVIGDENIQELQYGVGMRDGEEQDGADGVWQRHAQDPGARLPKAGMGLGDDVPHHNVGYPVEDARDQHDHTHDGSRNAGIIGVKHDEQRADHAKDQVAGDVAAAIRYARQKSDACILCNLIVFKRLIQFDSSLHAVQ